jgi:hypothetical protein
VADPEREPLARIGLCSICCHARAIRSAKGSEFWLCERSQTDARFAKYPRLPVRTCEGFERSETSPL